MTVKHIFPTLLILWTYTSVWTQTNPLQGYIEEAIENNLSLKTHDFSYRMQLSKIEQAKSNNSFQADLAANYLLARGGRAIEFPVGDLFNPTYAALNQLTGSDQFPTDLENVNTQLIPNNFIDAQLSISKPLINSNIRYNRLIQEELLQLSSINKRIEEKDLVLKVKTAYYNYHKSLHAEKIIDQSKDLLNDVQVVNKKLIKYDQATPDIKYDIEYQLQALESQRASVKQQQETSKALFNLLLNKSLDSEVETDPELINQELLSLGSLSEVQTKAGIKRAEFERIDLSKSVNELNKIRTKKEGSLQLGIQGGVGMQIEEFDFGRYGPLFTLGLGASMNFFDGGTRNKKIEEINVKQDLLEHNRLQLKQKFEIEATQLFYEIQSIQAKLISDQAAVDYATKSYLATKKRYENNQAILIEVIQAQNRITNTELNYVLTQYDLLIKDAEIDRAISK